MKNKIKKIVWKYVGIIYFPVYLLAWTLHKIARILLGISYYGMLNKKMGRDIFKYLFTYGRC